MRIPVIDPNNELRLLIPLKARVWLICVLAVTLVGLYVMGLTMAPTPVDHMNNCPAGTSAAACPP